MKGLLIVLSHGFQHLNKPLAVSGCSCASTHDIRAASVLLPDRRVDSAMLLQPWGKSLQQAMGDDARSLLVPVHSIDTHQVNMHGVMFQQGC